MRVLYIMSIVFQLVLTGIVVYFAAHYVLLGYSYYSYESGDPMQAKIYDSMIKNNLIFVVLTAVFFLFNLVLCILGYIKIKRKTNKVISIIGGVLTIVMLVWDGLVYTNYPAINESEVSLSWVGYTIVMLSFSIVGIVQYNRALINPIKKLSEDLLDDFD